MAARVMIDTNDGRQPVTPQDLDAERAVLGAVLVLGHLDNLSDLCPDDFFSRCPSPDFSDDAQDGRGRSSA